MQISNTSVAERLAVGMQLIVTLYGVYSSVVYCMHAFDVTDESFLLLNAAYPQSYVGRVSSYGVYGAILWSAVSGDLLSYRLVVLLLQIFIGSALATVIIRIIRKEAGGVADQLTVVSTYVVVILGALGGMHYKGIMALSYNVLSIDGAVVAICAALWYGPGRPAGNLSRGERIAIVSLLSLGIVIALTGKVTVVVLFVPVLFLYVCYYHWIKSGAVLIAHVCVLVVILTLIQVVVLEGGVGHFLGQYYKGVELQGVLGSGHGIRYAFYKMKVGLYDFASPVAILREWPQYVVLFAGVGVRHLARFRHRLQSGCVYFFLLGYVVTCVDGYKLFDVGVLARMDFVYAQTRYLFLLAFIEIIHERQHVRRNMAHYILPMLLLLMSAYAVMFATNVAIKVAVGHAYMLLSASVVVAVAYVTKGWSMRMRLSMHTVVIASVVLFVISSQQRHYRSDAMQSEMSNVVTLWISNTQISVDKALHGWVVGMQQAAIAAGWRRGEYLLDMTGATPGLAVVLGGRPLGVPWLLGGYSGSNKYAEAVLREVPDSSRRRAWILTAENGQLALDQDVLRRVGLHFPSDYTKVAFAEEPHREERQILWRPNK